MFKEMEEWAYLANAAFPFHFCCEPEGTEGWVLDLPKVASNLVLA
jgi:hypothetical protein